jgi:uncharacterized protein (DUF58 family)
VATSGDLTSPQRRTLLDSATLEKLGGLEIIARHVVDGFLQGMHRSPHVGFAMDFAHHRPYSPGDDVRRIDWRAFARSERFYLKQHEVSTNLRAHLLLDASGSMAYRGRRDVMTKFRYAQILAASLAYLILRQKDSVGLLTFNHRVTGEIPPGSVSSHFARLVTALDGTTTDGPSNIAPLLHELAARIRSRGMVIILSDLFDDTRAIVNSLHHLRREGHDVLIFQILSPDELDFPFRNWTTFESMEDESERRRLDPALVRATYLNNLHTHLDSLRDAAFKLGIRYLQITASEPPDAAIAKVLR